jgi:hypothetical protein
MNFWLRWLAVACLLAAVPASAATIYYTRDMSIYYGTLSVYTQGNPTPISQTDVVEMTDNITETLAGSIWATVPDPRFLAALPLWIIPLIDIDWILAPPDGFPAAANFDAAVAALPAGAINTSDTGFQLIDTRLYTITAWSSQDPILGLIDHIGQAQVAFYERNFSETLPAGIPEPSTAVLALPALALLFLRRRS